MTWTSLAWRSTGAVVALLVLAACTESPTDTGVTVEQPSFALGTLEYLEANPDAGILPDWFAPQPYFDTGDVLRTITGGGAACSVNTGIAFDGTNLIMSCWYRNSLDILSPADGSLISTLTVPGFSGYGALAWDNDSKTLWACGLHSTVVQVDLSDGSTLSSFPAQGSCTDGLAFDGADGTIYTSGDVQRTVYHWETDGTLIASHNLSTIPGINPGIGNSGIAVGGEKIYLADNLSANNSIFEVARDFSSGVLFAEVPRRIEDLECDDLTFAPDNAVIWQQDAYDRIIQAFEIPPGACPFGGGGGPAQVAVEVAPTQISLTASRMAQVYLLGAAGFDASVAEASEAMLVVDGAGPGAPVYSRSGRYYSAVRDFDGDGDLDQMFYFQVSDLVAAGLTTGMTSLTLQDHTGAVQYDGIPVSLPTILP